jgi:N6-adenosine-specific RNA methylase IME4
MTLFAPLPAVAGGFSAVSADPPWRFASNSDARPGRNARRHYATLTPAEIAALPLADAVARDAYLFLWIIGPFLALGSHIPIMQAWGFKPTAMGLTWIKLRRSLGAQGATSALFFTERDLFVGGGLTLRRNVEFCVLGKRGKPQRLAKDVFEIILVPVRDHSRKPDEAYRRIERYCAGPYLDLFSCERRDGWIPYGDETGKYDGADARMDATPRSAGANPSNVGLRRGERCLDMKNPAQRRSGWLRRTETPFWDEMARM